MRNASNISRSERLIVSSSRLFQRHSPHILKGLQSAQLRFLRFIRLRIRIPFRELSAAFGHGDGVEHDPLVVGEQRVQIWLDGLQRLVHVGRGHDQASIRFAYRPCLGLRAVIAPAGGISARPHNCDSIAIDADFVSERPVFAAKAPRPRRVAHTSLPEGDSDSMSERAYS